MLNILWAGMMGAGILWAAFHGNMEAVTNGALDSTKEAVTLCITMLGILSFWCGILKIGEEAGLIAALTSRLRPVIRFLFPGLPEGHPAEKHIATNMIANILGLGWAATPAGLAAMKSLEALEEERRQTAKKDETAAERKDRGRERAGKEETGNVETGKVEGKEDAETERTASDEMCTFLIINISSLQLIPINMIAYRSQYGSASPAAITGPAILATLISTGAAVLYCKWMGRRRK